MVAQNTVRTSICWRYLVTWKCRQNRKRNMFWVTILYKYHGYFGHFFFTKVFFFQDICSFLQSSEVYKINYKRASTNFACKTKTLRYLDQNLEQGTAPRGVWGVSYWRGGGMGVFPYTLLFQSQTPKGAKYNLNTKTIIISLDWSYYYILLYIFELVELVERKIFFSLGNIIKRERK